MQGRPSDKKTPELKPDIEINEDDLASSDKQGAGHNRFARIRGWWRKQGRNERFAIIASLLLVFGAGCLAWYYFIRTGANEVVAPTIITHKPKPKAPQTVASPLTGVQVTPDQAKRPVTGIMIENSPDARPQSGLQDAGVVYEAIAEGGITRFMALFQEARPQYIGPVRSLRPYFLDFAAPYQASIVHVGGSPDALKTVRNGNYRDLDQFFNSAYFSRVSSRAAPHNVYTDFSRLDKLNKSKGYTSSLFTPWPRKSDHKLAQPTAQKIDFQISGPLYYVHYDYDANTNSYLRSEGGAPHLDLTSAADRKGVRLHPKVVIALVMGYHLAADNHHSVYEDSGTGRAYFFQDGGVAIGSWSKTGTSGQLAFKDSQGSAMKLDAGQTWISLVGSGSMVGYKP
ncbi:MAG TPA: DUF3048 domain-containing protein [Candidatus Saccharimonadales bacterium]|nr:DUF3048 domain-containing protein [Candidatus Saccharimonadales bacterium]